MSRTLSCRTKNYYATTSQNNRIKIWETETPSGSKNEIANLVCEIVEPHHLKVHYTALALFDSQEFNSIARDFLVSSSHDDMKNDSNENENENLFDSKLALVALGDATGRIVLFNIDTNVKLLEISQHSSSQLNQVNLNVSDSSGLHAFVFTREDKNITKHVQGGHNSRVNWLQFNMNCSQSGKKNHILDLNGMNSLLDVIELFSCSNDKKVMRWKLGAKDVKNMCLDVLSVGGDAIPSCVVSTHFKIKKHQNKNQKSGDQIKLLHLNNSSAPFVVVGCNHIQVFDLTQKNASTPIASYNGHASRIRKLILTKDNKFCISSAHDRFLYLWKLNSHWKKHKKGKTPSAGAASDSKSLVLESALQCMSLNDEVIDLDVWESSRTIVATPKHSKSSKKKNKKHQNNNNNNNQNKSQSPGSQVYTQTIYYIAAATKSMIHIYLFDPKAKSSNVNMNESNSSKTKSKSSKKNKNAKVMAQLDPICKISLSSQKSSNSNSDDITFSWIRGVQFIDSKRIIVARGSAALVIFKKVEFALGAGNDPNDANEFEYVKDVKLDLVEASTFIGANGGIVGKKGRSFEKEQMTAVSTQLSVLDVADAARPQPKMLQLDDLEQNDVEMEKIDNKNQNSNKKDVAVVTGQKRSRKEKEMESEMDHEMDGMDEMENKKYDLLDGMDAMDLNEENDGNDGLEPPPKKKLKFSGDNKSKNENESKSTGLTFAEKLAEMEVQDEENRKKGFVAGVPTADSLAELLKQSLTAHDQGMFENLLKLEDEGREFEDELIRNTLDRISQATALKLLKRLCMKFRTSPRKSVELLKWLVPLLNRHAGSFSKNLDSREYLESMNQAIDYQIKSILPAMKLQGRLSLLVNQIDKVKQLKAKNEQMKQSDDNYNNVVTDGLKQARKQALFSHFEDME